MLSDDLEEAVVKRVTAFKESGGVLTRRTVQSLAIATLETENPSVLAENGGDVNISESWAKSFLLRIGHSSKQDVNKDQPSLCYE